MVLAYDRGLTPYIFQIELDNRYFLQPECIASESLVHMLNLQGSRRRTSRVMMYNPLIPVQE